MSGNITIEDLDKALLGLEFVALTVARMIETSDLMKAGGEDGISDENLAAVKKRAANSFAELDALVNSLSTS